MKRNFIKLATLALCIMGLTTLVSCEKNYPIVERIVEVPGDTGPVVMTDTYQVLQTDWTWNSDLKRYEYRFDGIEAIDEVYDKGIVVGTIIVAEGDYPDVQKNLPFVHSYTNNAGQTFTEIISHDFYSDDKGMGISFYIQPSDLQQSSAFLSDYTFQMTFIFGELSQN